MNNQLTAVTAQCEYNETHFIKLGRQSFKQFTIRKYNNKLSEKISQSKPFAYYKYFGREKNENQSFCRFTLVQSKISHEIQLTDEIKSTDIRCLAFMRIVNCILRMTAKCGYIVRVKKKFSLKFDRQFHIVNNNFCR